MFISFAHQQSRVCDKCKVLNTNLNDTDKIKGAKRNLRSAKSTAIPSIIASKEVSSNKQMENSCEKPEQISKPTTQPSNHEQEPEDVSKPNIPKTSRKQETSSADEPESQQKDGKGELDVRVAKVCGMVYFVVMTSSVMSQDVLAINLSTMAQAEVPDDLQLQDKVTILPKATTIELQKLGFVLPLLEPKVKEFLTKYQASTQGFFARFERATEIAMLRAKIFEIKSMKKRKLNDDVILNWNTYTLEKLILAEQKKTESKVQAKPDALDNPVKLFDLSNSNFIPNAAGTPIEGKRYRSSSVSEKKPAPKYSRLESSTDTLVPKAVISKLKLPTFYLVKREIMPSNNEIASVSTHFILLSN